MKVDEILDSLNGLGIECEKQVLTNPKSHKDGVRTLFLDLVSGTALFCISFCVELSAHSL